MSSEWYIGFADGASHHTCNLASTAWVIYSFSGQLVTPIECEIPSLKIVIHVLPDTTELEERLVHLEHLDE